MIPLARLEANLERLGALAWSRRFCRQLGAPLEQVATGIRVTHVQRVRHEWWTTLGDTLGLSGAGLARVVGVDHTSIMHAYRKRERARAEGRR